MRRRVLAWLLVLSMAACMPATVNAQEEETDIVTLEEPESEEPESIGNTDVESEGAEDGSAQFEENGDESLQNQDDAEEDDVQNEKEETDEEAALPEISYQVHVQSSGWQISRKNGETAGTTGQSKRLEAIKLSVSGSEYEGGIEYQTHVQSYGWQDWVSDGAVSGTIGKTKRLEAIRIRLTGELEQHYDVYYRVHAQSYGWLDWAKNGEKAGSAAYAKRLESIEIALMEKGSEAPGETADAYRAPVIQYQTHVQSYGWQEMKFDGALSGTSGQSKRLESIRISLYDIEDLGYEGGIEYQTHVQGDGWQDWVSGGALSGTTGKAKRMEAIRIRLTGGLADYYSVYYRVHCETVGWLAWTKDGDSSGTEGFGKRMEAIEIRLVSRESGEVPDTSGQAYFTLIPDSGVTLFGKVLDEEDSEILTEGNDGILGSEEGEQSLEGFGICLSPDSVDSSFGSIQYRAHCQSDGWKDWIEQGEYAGTVAENKRLEAIQISLTGTLSKLYNVYYRTYVETFGWLDWTVNGSVSGTTGYSSCIQAIQVRMVPKNQSGPAVGKNAYIKAIGAGVLRNPCPTAFISDEFGGREAPTAGASTNHKGRDYAANYGAEIYAASTGIVKKVDYNGIRGNYVIIDHGNGLSTVYQHCSKIIVSVGEPVFVGAKIAEVGSTGISTGPHLHFEVWVNGTPVDPRIYL